MKKLSYIYCSLKKTFFSVLFLLSCSSDIFAAGRLDLVAVNPASVKIEADNQIRHLRIGDEHKGIYLISIQGSTAVFEINGRRQRLSEGSQIAYRSTYQPKNTQLVLERSEDGHHWVKLKINGVSAKAVIDTGASVVVINERMAKQFKADFSQSEPFLANTANGSVEGRTANLKAVKADRIIEYNIEAAVLPDQSLDKILLGNSFLSRLNMRVQGDRMVLEK